MGRISGPPDGSDQQQHGDNFRESITSTLRGSDDTMTVSTPHYYHVLTSFDTRMPFQYVTHILLLTFQNNR